MNTVLHASVPCLVGLSFLLSACGNMSKKQVIQTQFLAGYTQTYAVTENEVRRTSDCDTINESPACGTI